MKLRTGIQDTTLLALVLRPGRGTRLKANGMSSQTAGTETTLLDARHGNG